MPVLSTREDLRSVLADSQTPAISIFVPTHRAGQKIRQDPIRLKNLVKEAPSIVTNTRSSYAHQRPKSGPWD